MALRALVKKTTQPALPSTSRSVVDLYRIMIRELPRVMAIYDVDIPLKEAIAGVQYHFRKNGDLKDTRVISFLVSKGYMELEETLLQWKQKTHLLERLQPRDAKPAIKLTPAEELHVGRIYNYY
mmetsp:Transcript_14417/g.15083  ORF Transcript_14417/g.15083 Transcript_14417/m.15083 type:complete len:124 (-) Transcript_14417:70-441(-)